MTTTFFLSPQPLATPSTTCLEDEQEDEDFLYMVDEPEVFSFVQKMPNAKAVRAAVDLRFFREDLHKPLQTLYAVKDVNEGFVCKVYTHEDSNFVVKYMRDTDARRLNGKYRWYPELLNHRLAWRLCPDRTLAMYAAYVGVEDDSYFFVYERGRNLSADEEVSKLSEALQVIEHFNGLGLLHLDTKLSNFLMNVSGNVCLHDWGMALSVDHGIPGDLMYSDPFGDDKHLWQVLSEQAAGRRYPDVILQWTRMCQGRLLLAKIKEAPVELGVLLRSPEAFRDFTAGVGLGLEDFYNSPMWFKDFHSVLCGFSATIVSRSFADFITRS